jgi:hypothetical protein
VKPSVPLDNPRSNLLVNPFVSVKFSARLVLLSGQQAVAAGRPQSFSVHAHGYSVEPGYSSPATRVVPNTERPVGDSLFQSGQQATVEFWQNI